MSELKFKDVFISYGRKESLAFAAQLHQQIRLKGLDAWFDKVNIPSGEDYVKRIQAGIRNAHNFIFVMAPHSLTSQNCLDELVYAESMGKRIYPLNHIEETQEITSQYSEDQKRVRKEVAEILGNRDWLMGRELLGNLAELNTWKASYENTWKNHESQEYLETWQCPIQWKSIDKVEEVVEKFIEVRKTDNAYVELHTKLLFQAYEWDIQQRQSKYLLVGDERKDAGSWLRTEFNQLKLPPCRPTDLQCEFICESQKNFDNLKTDIFICYDTKDIEIRDKVIRSLSRNLFTTWTNDRDILQSGDWVNWETAIKTGIVQADNLLFFISPTSLLSKNCLVEIQYAQKMNKRIIPLLVKETPVEQLQRYEAIENLDKIQYVDFTDNARQTDYDNDVDQILNILRKDQAYYELHKEYLSKASIWEKNGRKNSFLLRGHNLDSATTWLRLYEDRELHSPVELHHDFIKTSQAAKGSLGTDVFISYSRKDGDFARKINERLQQADFTTWFDQESISSGVDFEQEILRGIESSDNIIFIISPDSIESQYCEREVEYAESEGKRFIPILLREVEDDSSIPEPLRIINWVIFTDTQQQNAPEKLFDARFAELIQAIELDKEHAHQHTILQQRANEWEENNRSEDFLLNNNAYNNAQAWLTDSGDKIEDSAGIRPWKSVKEQFVSNFFHITRKDILKHLSLIGFSAVLILISFYLLPQNFKEIPSELELVYIIALPIVFTFFTSLFIGFLKLLNPSWFLIEHINEQQKPVTYGKIQKWFWVLVFTILLYSVIWLVLLSSIQGDGNSMFELFFGVLGYPLSFITTWLVSRVFSKKLVVFKDNVEAPFDLKDYKVIPWKNIGQRLFNHFFSLTYKDTYFIVLFTVLYGLLMNPLLIMSEKSEDDTIIIFAFLLPIILIILILYTFKKLVPHLFYIQPNPNKKNKITIFVIWVGSLIQFSLMSSAYLFIITFLMQEIFFPYSYTNIDSSILIFLLPVYLTLFWIARRLFTKKLVFEDIENENTQTIKIKNPQPTLLQKAYIYASQIAIDISTAKEREGRNRLFLLLVIAIIAIPLSIVTSWLAYTEYIDAKQVSSSAYLNQIELYQRDINILQNNIDDALKNILQVNYFPNDVLIQLENIENSFYLGAYEVTFQQFMSFCLSTNNGIHFEGSDFSYIGSRLPNNNHPVNINSLADSYAYENTKMDYRHVAGYCNWLSVQQGYKPVYSLEGNTNFYENISELSTASNFTVDMNANGYRLPTVEEWNTASKLAINELPYENLSAIAWHSGNTQGVVQTIGLKYADNLGLHDLYGNIAEICMKIDKNNPTLGYNTYVLKGGSVQNIISKEQIMSNSIPENKSTPTNSFNLGKDDNNIFMGFRICRSYFPDEPQ